MLKEKKISKYKIHVDNLQKVMPAFEEKSVNIAFVSDDVFANFLGVAINSVIMNADKERCYDIIVITTKMADENIFNVVSLAAEKDNIAIRFAFVSELIKDMEFLVSANYNNFTYYRLLLPDILESMDRILYLDADTIINYDVAELYDMDFEGNYLIGTYDVQIAAWQNYDSGMRAYFNALRVGDSGQYVQAGVLLFNLEQLVKDNKCEEIIKSACNEKYIFNDQDLINIYFKGKIKIVDLSWNVLNLGEDGLMNCHNFLSAQQLSEYERARIEPKIIHYAERSFPCFRESPYAEIYWHYTENTLFYARLMEIKKARMNEGNKRIEDVAPRRRARASIRGYLKKIPFVVEIVHKMRNVKQRGMENRSKLDLNAMNASGVHRMSDEGLVIKAGEELSGLNCMWGKGIHSVNVTVVGIAAGDNIQCKMMAGCRHILLAEKKIQDGLNELECILKEGQVDVEFILKNDTSHDIIVCEIELVHR